MNGVLLSGTSTDFLLLFPPQWSPFLPPLSLPSLSAWLRRAGFQVSSLDLNILFYEWLLSDECAALLLDELGHAHWPEAITYSYLTVLQNAADFREDLDRMRALRSVAERPDPGEFLRRHYLAMKSLETYLRVVSLVTQDCVISPYGFHLRDGEPGAPRLEQLIARPPRIIEHLLRFAITRYIISQRPRLIGISCIGQEQLYFTLLLGRLLKEQTHVPIVVGGTILSRIFERGALRPQWFGRFFDAIVRNEGEKPGERLLSNVVAGRPLPHEVPGLVYLENGRLECSAPCPPLAPAEIPVPDFDDLPLERYWSADVTLPLLASRGCYWGRCEFCHHGMVYGDGYGSYTVDTVLSTVERLAAKYHVRQFAFCDEAIPPKVIRAMGQAFPSHSDSGWCFSGLIKFEPYFQREDFANLHRIGFRALYVGLESASERVLTLMRKNNTRSTMLKNLRDANAAGLWMHCFLFFGFPGETERDAEETYDFVLSNSDIIGSFGCSVFVLEHNAPIFHHPEDFGVTLNRTNKNDVDVYYEYAVANGLTQDRALTWMQRLNSAAQQVPKYYGPAWLTDEHLLGMLAVMTPERLVEQGLRIRTGWGLPEGTTLPEVMSYSVHPIEKDRWIFTNRLNGHAVSLTGGAARLLRGLHDNRVEVRRSATHLRATLGDWLLSVDESPARAVQTEGRQE